MGIWPGTYILLSLHQLRSQKLQKHLREQRERGKPHTPKPRRDSDRRTCVRVLDLPLPRTLSWQPQRCDTCRLSRCGLAAFAVTDDDILAAAPQVLRHDPKKRKIKEKPLFFTRSWLLHTLQNFNESLCAREVRRTLMKVYSANCLAFGRRHMSLLHALPSSHALRSLILTAFDKYLDAQVLQIQQQVCTYSGQIIRGDGHWKLARRVISGGRRPFTALCLSLRENICACLFQCVFLQQQTFWGSINARKLSISSTGNPKISLLISKQVIIKPKSHHCRNQLESSLVKLGSKYPRILCYGSFNFNQNPTRPEIEACMDWL